MSTSGRIRSNARRRTARLAAVTTAIGLAATGCGGTPAAGGDSTITIAIPADPGSLDPITTVNSAALNMNEFAYDPLVHPSANGTVIAGVAQTWSATTTSASFTLHPGVTCQDGSPLRASDVAAEYNYIADPKNQSPMLGLSVPVTTVAKADDATRTVTLRTTTPAPFIVQMAELLPLVCRRDLADSSALARATDATGAYRLTQALPGDQYVYVKRAGYDWGPGGADGAAMPDKVVFKVVASESTAANMLLAGEINVAEIDGSDGNRLDATRMRSQSLQQLSGELLFDESSGHATADAVVRRALAGAMDVAQIGAVATGGSGTPATNLGEIEPTPCSGDTVTGNVPSHDTARAAAELTGDGWTKSGGTWVKDSRPLTVALTYPTGMDSEVDSAIQLMVQQWMAFGVKVTTTVSATIVSTLASASWDVAWTPLGVALPNQLTPFFAGPRPPQGSNFGGVDNPAYAALTARASKLPGTAGCALWDEADASLIKRVDVLPIEDSPKRVYGKGVTFQIDGSGAIPSSLRQIGG